MKRRDKINIFADMLRIATSGANKTQIVYRAFLNSTIVKRYLSELIKMGLIVGSDRLYRTTERGLTFLECYDGLASILDSDLLTIDIAGEVHNVVQQG